MIRAQQEVAQFVNERSIIGMEDRKVIIYSGTNCSHCEAAKQYFYDNAIEYEEHNINEDKKAKNLFTPKRCYVSSIYHN